jgi:monofunctional biosynthetic peptidoglycan transglycosylase
MARQPPKVRGRRIARALMLAMGAALAGIVLFEGWFLAHVIWWRSHDPTSTAFMDRRLAVLRERNPKAELRHQWVPYERISAHLKRAIVAAEDDKFLDHDGFDWDGIQRAIEKNQKKGKPVAGGSTISQQLAKNLFLSGERSYLRKGQEALITAMLEAAMDKRRILEVYMNVVEWGEGVFGAEAAARHHFGVSASALSPDQAARLAAMLPRPRYYDRNRASSYLEEHSARIRARMGASQIP